MDRRNRQLTKDRRSDRKGHRATNVPCSFLLPSLRTLRIGCAWRHASLTKDQGRRARGKWQRLRTKLTSDIGGTKLGRTFSSQVLAQERPLLLSKWQDKSYLGASGKPHPRFAVVLLEADFSASSGYDNGFMQEPTPTGELRPVCPFMLSRNDAKRQPSRAVALKFR